MNEISPTRPSLDMTDRVIIITGGATGIGKVYSQRLAEAGAKVVIADIVDEANHALADEINAAGGQALAQTTDVADEAKTKAMAQAAMDKWGRIDGLINNASLMSVLGRKPWHEIPADEWDRVMQVNTKGVFLCSLAVYPHMKKLGGGKIVNISSSRVFDGGMWRLHYSASKGAVVVLTRALAREVGEDNICVNSVSPGFTLSETQVANSSNEHMSKRADSTKCFNRDQLPDDLVGAVMFLLSDASNYITGQTINVDGGRSMH
ncbi:MAG: SDR family NAD(P)-dependent oxidoreductase [Alphaproteobacteria bacterium]|jgi:3-oxoacyl-[acyl-carrier protein] reductase